MKKAFHLKAVFHITFAVLCIALMAWYLLRPQYKMVEIGREDFDYIRFGGKYLMNDDAHAEVIDDLLEMVSGKYDYMGEWKAKEGMRISADSVSFYKEGKEIVLSVGLYDEAGTMFNIWKDYPKKYAFRMYFRPVSDPARLAEIKAYCTANGSEFASIK